MKKIMLLTIVYALVFVFVAIQKANCNSFDNATVKRIVDGDTLEVIYKSNDERVRLIGVDTPESFINKKAYRDARRENKDIETIIAAGKAAAKYTSSLIKTGDEVFLEFDVQPRDKYHRLLAYVYLKNGKMLNDELVKNGYASPMTVPPNVKYQKKFLESYKSAIKNKKGLWKESSNKLKNSASVDNDFLKEIKCSASCKKTTPTKREKLEKIYLK